MAPATPYKGPVALGYSKYASPHMRQALPANVAVPMSSIASTVADNIIATKEQIDATKEQSITEIKPKATAATLAISQGQALKEEIAEHTAKLSQTVSSTCSNTRKLLELIRTALQKVDPDALKTTEHLWAELEELFKVASNAKHALPDFLEKQRNSMALYHASQINDVYRDTQMELDIQHNKVNLQHGLILEQQQAYKDHKARTEGQLQERDELKDRLSRLTLEKGHLRTELDEQSHIILEGVTTRAENSEKMTTLQQDNDKHEAEITELSNTITSMREKQDAIKKDFTERFTAEIHRKDEQLAKKSAECVTLKEENSRLTMEAEKGKEEKSRMEKKLAYMSHEHATLFSVR